MNRITLLGRLTRDPELSYTPNTQTAVCVFSLAVDRPRKNGESQGADFFRIKVFGRRAETCDKWLCKGREVVVNGRVQTGSYKKDGRTVYTWEVIPEDTQDGIRFLGGGNRANNAANTASNAAAASAPANSAAPHQNVQQPVQQTMQDLPGAAPDDFDNGFGSFDAIDAFESFDR